MGGKGAPPAPDYKGATEAQAQASQQAVGQQTAANRPNQYGPFGYSSWQQGPGGQWTQNSGFSGLLQGAANDLMGQYAQANKSGIDYGSMPSATPYGGQFSAFDPSQMQQLQPFSGQGMRGLDPLNPGAVPQYQLPGLQHLDSPGTGMDARNKAEDALYQRSASRLDPQWAQQEQAQRTQLMQQGLDPDSQAFQRQMDTFGRARNDAYGQARQDAIAGGGQEQALQFGMGLQGNNQQLQQQQMAQQRGAQDAQLGYQGYGLGLQAQNQQFGQGLSANEQAMRGQAQGFGQGLAANQQQMQGQGQQFGQQMAGQQAQYGQGMDARRQALAEALQQRNGPLQQLLQMQGFGQMPAFMGAGAAQVPNYFGAAQAGGQYGLNAADMNGQMWGDIGQGVGTLGMNAISLAPLLGFLSDERVKDNVTRWPVEAAPGVPIATFEYKHEPGKLYAGVLAQDIERAAPDHVRTGHDGLKRVSARFAPVAIP